MSTSKNLFRENHLSYIKVENSTLTQEIANTIEELDLQGLGLLAWKRNAWQDCYDHFHQYVLHIIEDKEQGKIEAFALFHLLHGDEMAHLLKIAVRDEVKKQGYGEALLRFSFEDLQTFGVSKIYLEVLADNEAAVRLYRKLSFQELHKSRNFYGQGLDALKMLREA